MVLYRSVPLADDFSSAASGGSASIRRGGGPALGGDSPGMVCQTAWVARALSTLAIIHSAYIRA
jgi:hypothetical protein